MARRELKAVLVRMPSTLKRRLAHEVGRRDSTMNDVAVGILAQRFGVEFEPSGRRGPVPGDSGVVLLRIPAELKRAIQSDAHDRGISTNSVIVRALADSLGVHLETRKEAMATTNGSKQNGRVRSEDKVRVAIIGVGNCANSLLQGVEYYKDAPDDHFVPGLMHVNLGGYHVRDIEFTAAFDVTTDKVGKELVRRDLGASERHDQVRRRPEDRYHGVARHDPRRPRQVPVGGRDEGAGRDGRRRRHPQGDQDGRRRELSARSVPRWRPSGTRSRSSRPAARW